MKWIILILSVAVLIGLFMFFRTKQQAAQQSQNSAAAYDTLASDSGAPVSGQRSGILSGVFGGTTSTSPKVLSGTNLKNATLSGLNPVSAIAIIAPNNKGVCIANCKVSHPFNASKRNACIAGCS